MIQNVRRVDLNSLRSPSERTQLGSEYDIRTPTFRVKVGTGGVLWPPALCERLRFSLAVVLTIPRNGEAGTLRLPFGNPELLDTFR